MRKNLSGTVSNKTSDNQRLGSAFDDLDPRLSLLCDVVRLPLQKKYAGDATCVSQDPSIQCCPIQSQLKSALGVRSSYVERN